MLGRASVVWRVGGLFFLWMCTSHVNVWAAKTYTRHPLQLTKFSRALERFHKRKPGDSQAHRKEILRLANWGGEHAFPLLRTVMRSYSWEMHEYTVDIFQKINRKKVTQVLLACLQSRDATTRENAAEVLTRRQGKALTRGLIRLLRHRNWRVRKLAAELLASTGQTEAVPALMHMLQGKHPKSREHAAQALGRLVHRVRSRS